MYRKQNNDAVSNLLSEHISNKQTNKQTKSNGKLTLFYKGA